MSCQCSNRVMFIAELHLWPCAFAKWPDEPHLTCVGNRAQLASTWWLSCCVCLARALWGFTMCLEKGYFSLVEALISEEGSASQEAWWEAQELQSVCSGVRVPGLARQVLHCVPQHRHLLLPAQPPSSAPLPEALQMRGHQRSLTVSAAQFPPLTVIRLVHPETLLQVLSSDFGVQDLLPHRTGEPAPLLVMKTLPKYPA